MNRTVKNKINKMTRARTSWLRQTKQECKAIIMHSEKTFHRSVFSVQVVSERTDMPSKGHESLSHQSHYRHRNKQTEHFYILFLKEEEETDTK